ncbi:hypothetical protein [Rahnella variigena]|uniref:hypothetical protein n=1 Tax=Rahnella variigena TaxID=574964 RepID=UPI001FC9D867|nr:hypothetical protein [Rahnella variigena]
MGFSSGTAFATVCLMSMIYYNTLLFLIFAAMMLLANVRFRVTHQARADAAEDLQLRGLRPVRGKSGK